LAGLFNRKKSDPMWDHFINRPPVDSNGDLAAALVGGSEGRVFPVKSNEPDPVVMAQNMKHLARWWGADFVGIVPLPPGQGQVVIPSGDAEPEDAPPDAQPHSGADVPTANWFVVVCALLSEYDPEVAKGVGGQFVRQRGAVVVQHLGAFIRETGFRAAKAAFDPIPLAESAGLGKVDRQRNLKVDGKRGYVHVTQAVVTNLPLAVDNPAGPGQ
jgi:hypothetical protein